MLHKFLPFVILLLCSQISAQKINPWIVEAKDINPANYYGVTSANGMIGLVSSPEPMKVEDVVLNGVFDIYQRGRVSNILKVFNHVNMNLDVDGQRISRGNISNYAQTLEMKTAAITTTFEMTGKVKVKHQLMALRHLPYTALTIVEIEALDNVKISPASVIEAPVHLADNRNLFSQVDRPHVLIPLMSSVAKSPTGKHTVAASNSFIFTEKHGHEPHLIHEEWDQNYHLLKFHKTLKRGEKYTFAVVSSVASTREYDDPLSEAERLTLYAKLEGVDRLLNRHIKAWEDIWRSDIIVEDKEIERDIRFALYHLYSFCRANSNLSLSPMGLSGLGYNGHVFWDTEMWMYPPLLIMQPEMARSLLEYRFERLEAARQNAFSHGYEGAMFPWESAASGNEDTPAWALTGPFQHHISADIGWAFWKYYQVTKDEEFLETRAWPILKEVATFWVSRVEEEKDGTYSIRNVIGANEYEENIDNNAYTNAMAKIVLEYAAQAAEKLGHSPNPAWRDVASKLPVLKFANGVTRENETYDGAIIKQADVSLLAHPLYFITDKEQVEKDLAYYEERMDPKGPAMGFAILAILNNMLDNTDKAEKIFVDSYRNNAVPPFGVMAETAGGTNPYFATGAGGMLQAVLTGFGGIWMDNDGLKQEKRQIPKSWGTLTIKGVGPQKITYKVD